MSNTAGELRPLNVLLTFDIEVWCAGWQDLDDRFPAAFSRYVYGASRAGNYALPKTLEIMNDHGLKGVFFVEPLFATRFGLEHLAEIVGLIRQAGQEVQLHLHPEWQNEAITPLISNHETKRQHLFMYDVDEQAALISHGLRLLNEAGADPVSAFRAGSFACNADTFTALKRNGIRYDSSLNVSMDHSGMDLLCEDRRAGYHCIEQIMELPVSVFRSANGGLRHVQVGACACSEMVQAMQSARLTGWSHFVILSHNFEMLQPGNIRPDWVVVRRFTNLCRYLEQHSAIYPTVNFSADVLTEEHIGLPLPSASAGAYMRRNTEQAARRLMAMWPG